MATSSEIRKSFQRLREDSIARKMDDLTIAYGWSLIRFSVEAFEEGVVPRTNTMKDIINDGRT